MPRILTSISPLGTGSRSFATQPEQPRSKAGLAERWTWRRALVYPLDACGSGLFRLATGAAISAWVLRAAAVMVVAASVLMRPVAAIAWEAFGQGAYRSGGPYVFAAEDLAWDAYDGPLSDRGWYSDSDRPDRGGWSDQGSTGRAWSDRSEGVSGDAYRDYDTVNDRLPANGGFHFRPRNDHSETSGYGDGHREQLGGATGRLRGTERAPPRYEDGDWSRSQHLYRFRPLTERERARQGQESSRWRPREPESGERRYSDDTGPWSARPPRPYPPRP